MAINNGIRKSVGEKIFDVINIFIMLIIIITTLYPFLHIAAISFNDAIDSTKGGIGIWPRKFSVDSYITVFRYNSIFSAFIVSLSRTVIGTAGALFITFMAAYPMTKKNLIGYKFFYRFFVVSMFVAGGLIPTFFLYQWLNIYNTFFVYILPGLFSVYNMILMRTFIIQLPKSLEESAMLDGASEFTVFTKIIVPMSRPILATIGLFIAVAQWNAWSDTLFFTIDPKLETLQYVLMKVLRKAEAASVIRNVGDSTSPVRPVTVTPESVKMAITMVSTLPILCVYPFVQKYFIKGIMIGAVKG